MSYMCITRHFIDSDWKLQKRVLNFVDIPPPHTGIEIADTVYKCKKEWVENEIFTISVDNASSNDVAIRILSEKFPRSRKLPLFHVKCCAHNLNLNLQNGLSEIKYIIQDVKESARFVDQSEARLEKFTGIAQQITTSSKKVDDCPTRQTSTYDLLVAASKVKDKDVSFRLSSFFGI
jgi:hypothetical protein